jgi:group I intron endonuclease
MTKNLTIYKIVSPSGRVYVGQTNNYKVRLRQYRHSANPNSKTSAQVLINRSLRRHGYENHTFSIIETFESDYKYIDDREMFWIRSYMSNKRKYPKSNGLNLTDGGDGIRGYKMTEDNKRKLSLRQKGRPSKMKGKTMHTEEEKKRIGERKKGNKYCAGFKHTEQSRGNMSRGKSYAFKEVCQFDLSDNFIGLHESIRAASRLLGIDYGQMKGHISGGAKSCKGFVFKSKQQILCEYGYQHCY